MLGSVKSDDLFVSVDAQSDRFLDDEECYGYACVVFLNTALIYQMEIFSPFLSKAII